MRLAVLDHGYIETIDAWGVGRAGEDFEVGIIEAARQSTQGSFRGWADDEKLLKHLYNNKHSTPFEFAGLIVEVQAPIFVFREWQRHRTQSYNEMSARYSPLPDLCYTPSGMRVREVNEPTNNKQASNVDGTHLTPEDAAHWRDLLEQSYALAQKAYSFGLKAGVAKELARCSMPVGHYSRMRASANLRNWLQFLTLRSDPKAQWEIRQYALALETMLTAYFPRTLELWRA